MKDAFISIILPNYNHALFLQQRIDTIFNQSYENYELILLDDCSTDNSRTIIENYRNHPKVSHVVYNDTNSGSLFSQWKKGINLARGEWIWIAESDDYSSPFFLERLVEKITENVVLVYSKSSIVDVEGVAYSDTTQWLKDLSATKWDSDFVEEGKVLFSEYWAYKNIVSNTSSVLFRKDIVKKILFPEGFQYCGDWLFFAQFCFYGDIAHVAEPLNFWRQHDRTTRNIFSLEKEVVRMNENTKIIRFFKKLAKTNNLCVLQKKYYWLVDRWLCFFTYKNLFQVKYVNPSFSIKLKFVFYIRLIKRFVVESCKSIKNKLTI